jgi:hypothetical protein
MIREGMVQSGTDPDSGPETGDRSGNRSGECRNANSHAESGCNRCCRLCGPGESAERGANADANPAEREA